MRSAMFQQILGGRSSVNPFLVLTVHRDQVIADALRQLASFPSSQFRKPLKVIFDGEQGVDEGGVQKEFFQLLMEELYNEDFGMFERVDDERHNFWFSKSSFENNLQFELFGSLLGLAIYNQVILDVKFPPALYKKLMGCKPGDLNLSDLMDFQPTLARGLIQLLEFEEDVEATFCRNFSVSYESFGATVTEELKPGGQELPVTSENREEYVRLYCD